MSLGNLCQCSVTLTGKNCFLMFRQGLLCFIWCPLLLFMSLNTAEKTLAPCLYPSFTYLCTLMGFSLSFLQAEQSQLSQLFLI